MYMCVCVSVCVCVSFYFSSVPLDFFLLHPFLIPERPRLTRTGAIPEITPWNALQTLKPLTVDNRNKSNSLRSSFRFRYGMQLSRSNIYQQL